MVLLTALLTFTGWAQDEGAPTTRVGLPLTLTDLYIPGGEAKPKPRPNRQPPIVVRLLEVKPAQEGKRYDFEIYGLEPGEYDLADYLEAVDPSQAPQFPKIPLTITSELPAGLPKPADPPPVEPKKVGGYTTTLWVLGIFWVIGLIAIIVWRRKSPPAPAAPEEGASTADRLRTLLTAASQGSLDDDQKAALERLILGHWRQRLPDLADLPAGQALSTLRHHQEAGPLLIQLEQWIHKPDGELSSTHLDELLAPYRE